MSVRGLAVLDGIRFAAGVASDPSGVVTLWKAASGGMVVGCLPETPIPELPYAAGMLSIAIGSPGDLSLLSGSIDAWMIGPDPAPIPVPPGEIPRFAFPRTAPGTVEEALDRVEALAEWLGSVSGSPASEGALWKSIRAYASRRSVLDALDERIARENAFLTPEERRDIARAGLFIPPEAHSRLLSMILGIDPEPAANPGEGDRGDPLLHLAMRLL